MLVGGDVGQCHSGTGRTSHAESVRVTRRRLHLCLPLGSMPQDGETRPNIAAAPSIDPAHVWYMRTGRGQP
jgi:hypothetical protein